MDGNSSTHWMNTVATDANITKKNKKRRAEHVSILLLWCVEVCSPIDWCLPLGLVLFRTFFWTQDNSRKIRPIAML